MWVAELLWLGLGVRVAWLLLMLSGERTCRPLLRLVDGEWDEEPTNGEDGAVSLSPAVPCAAAAGDGGMQYSDSVRLVFFLLAVLAARLSEGSGALFVSAAAPPSVAARVGCSVRLSRASSSTASSGTGRGLSVGAAVGEVAVDGRRRQRAEAALAAAAGCIVCSLSSLSLSGVMGAVERRRWRAVLLGCRRADG